MRAGFHNVQALNLLKRVCGDDVTKKYFAGSKDLSTGQAFIDGTVAWGEIDVNEFAAFNGVLFSFNETLQQIRCR